MSDTPRTNAAAVSSEFVRREMDYYAHKFVLADFARQLERELAEARNDAKRLRDAYDHICMHIKFDDGLAYMPENEFPRLFTKLEDAAMSAAEKG